MKHSASYNSPGSLSSPVIVAAAFPATVGTSGALRPQSWSRQRSHIKTPHTLLVNANTKSNVVQRANRVSARSLNSVHEGAIPPHNNNNHNSKAVHELHVRRGHRQPRRPRKNGRGSAAADEEEAAEETAAAPSHAEEKESITDAAAVHVKQPQQEQEKEEEMKAARKTRRRQTRRRKHTAQADQLPHGEEEQQQPQQQQVKLCEKNEEAKKAVTTSAAAVMVGNETTTTQPSVQSCVQNTQSSTAKPSNEATCVEMLSHPLPLHAERTDNAAHNESQPLRRQRRRRAQQRLKRKQRRAHDEGTHSTTPTPPSPSPHTETHTEANAAPSLGVPLPLQGQAATQAKGSGCSTTTNTTTTTSLSSSSQHEEQQTRPTHEGRHSTEHSNHHIAVTTLNMMMMNDTEKPKRPRRRRQRRQRLQRQAAAEVLETADTQLSHAPAKEEEKEKKAAAAAAIGRESSTQPVPASSPLVPDAAEEDETHTFSSRTHNAATSSALLSSHIPSLLSAPPAAMARSSQKRSAASPPSRPTAASYNTQVNTNTSTSNVSMSITRGSPARRVGMLAAFPSRPDLTQLAFTDLVTLPSTTAFSLSSGVTAGLNEEEEEVQCEGREEDNTSPMTLATSCSPASANAPAPKVYGRNVKRTTTTTTTTKTDPNAMNTSVGRGAEDDEVGLRRRGLRVRAVAFQPRHASGDEKDMQTGDEASMSGPIAAMMQSQSEYEEPQEGAEAAVVRARRSRRARPLIRHNFSVSDVDNVQHSCVAMSDVVAKDETLMFNMLVHSDEAGNAGANEGDEEEGSGIRAAGNDANGEAGEEEEQEDDDDDDEEEEEVLMDLCGLRGAAPHAASVPRHLAPGGGYWSEDNSHSTVWSAAGGMSSCGPSRPGQELSSYYYGMSYGRVSHRASQPPASQQRQRSQPSLSYYETLTPQIAALLPPHGNLSLHTSPTRTNRGTMSVMSTTEVMTDVDQWEMNSSAYEESLDEAQVQWIEEQLRASENPEGFFG